MEEDSIFNRLYGQVAPHPEMAEAGPGVSHMGRGREADGTYSRQLLKDKVMAEMALNRQGSLMGSEKTNQRAFEAGSPILSTIQKAIDFANPMNWMGGMGGASTSGAIINNLAGMKGVRSIGQLMKMDRPFVEALHKVPEQFNIRAVPQEVLGMESANARLAQRAPHQIQEANIQMGEPILASKQSGEVLGHELTHGYSLTRPRLMSNTVPEEQFKKMHNLLPDQAKADLELNLMQHRPSSGETPMYSEAERRKEEILGYFMQNSLRSRGLELAGKGSRDLSDLARRNYMETQVSPLFGVKR